jgi:myo-inositol-1(or 4)-monophosphatase
VAETSIDTRRALEVAIDAARAGGRLARARLGHPGSLTWKGHRDVVCDAAIAVQDAIVATLAAAFPQAGVLAEEGPEDAPVPVEAADLWIVDPICGSLNFVQGIPHFAVSIALRTGGTIRAAAVFDPCRDELFAATLDGPATLNGRPIVVQQISEGSEAWASAIVGTDWPAGGTRRQQAQAVLMAMIDQVGEVTLMGSPSLGLCYVAAGRLHAYWHLDLRVWDIAAASLILQRAGATLTDTSGMTWLYSDGGYIATNGIIHGSTLNCVQAIVGGRS